MDYNFYEPIKKQKKKTNYTGLLIFLILAIVLGWQAYRIVEKYFAKQEAQTRFDEADSLLNDPQLDIRLAELEKLEVELIQSRLVNQFLEMSYERVQQSHAVDTKFIDALVNAKWNTTNRYLAISITGENFTISGESGSMIDIAMMEENLRNAGYFLNINVASMKLDDGGFEEYRQGNTDNLYSFSATFQLPEIETLDSDDITSILEYGSLEEAAAAEGAGEEGAEDGEGADASGDNNEEGDD